MGALLHESSKILQILDRDNPENISIDRSGGAGGGFNVQSYLKGSEEQKLFEEKKLIATWRDLALQPKVENALMDIWNEAVVADSKDPVNVDTSQIDIGEEKKNTILKDEVEKSFSRILKRMNFKTNGTKIFKDWYVDGRLYIYFEKNSEGIITAIRFLDPLKLTFVKKSDKEYIFEYEESRNLYQGVYGEKLEIPSKNVLFIPSGLKNADGLWLSYLNKAVRPINLLQLLENSLVIHRFVRSPERWVFKIDVSSMNRKRAKAYIEKLRNQYRSRFSINSTTGEISAENTTLAMQENIYIPKTGSQNGGHEIDTIGGSSSFGDIADVLYYKDEVAMSLNLPVRDGQDATFLFGGKAEEISRAEYKWFRFIKWLRGYFNNLFLKLIKTELLATKVLTEKEWEEIKDEIQFIYENDSIYEESKRINKIIMKLDLLKDYAETVEEWYGEEWLRRNLLGDSEEDIKKYMEIRKKFKTKVPEGDSY